MAMQITGWDDFIGHANVIRYIRKQFDNSAIQQVVLFQGKAGVGKSSMAKLLAVDLTTRGKSTDERQKCIETVIRNNQSTDSIKLFSMSNIRDRDEEILKVKSEMNTAFSNSGIKILILDEAQGISTKAQDSILIELEHLPKGVYIFLCTTESGVFSEAFESRIKSTFYLSDLNQGEAQRLVRRAIEDRQLRFELNQRMVVSLICQWSKHQPRKALNLIENFERGSYVSVKDLEVFIQTNSESAMVELLKYLYGSLVMGLDYLENLKYDSMFATSVIELCKVAMGQPSDLYSKDNVKFIHEFMTGQDVSNIIQFTARVAGLSSITKRRVVAAFMQSHISYKQQTPAKFLTDEMRMADMRTMAEQVQRDLSPVGKQDNTKVMSLEMLIAQSECIE